MTSENKIGGNSSSRTMTVGVSLAEHRANRIYVAGPMTGLPELNFQAFNTAANELRAEDWHVENPAEHGIVDGAQWSDYMHTDLQQLSNCCAIYLLPGWSKSRGATLEAHVAQALGMALYYAPNAEAQAEPVHPDDAAVDTLAAKMKAKLAKQRAKGYGGWDTPECSQRRLSTMLREHVAKGDPVDVANFCAFLAARGEGIAAGSEPRTDAPAAVHNYGEMSRAELERHTARLAQALEDDAPREFWRRHAFAPLHAPSCLCCGLQPESVAIQHLDLPSEIVCGRCRDAVARGSAQDQPVDALDAREVLGDLAYALELLVGTDALHSLYQEGAMDATGRVKGTWSAAAEVNARATLKTHAATLAAMAAPSRSALNKSKEE